MAATIDDLLTRVIKPARYTGGEWNSVAKRLGPDGIRVALAYPDCYDVGMSNMGLGILYDILNGLQDVSAERVFAPWPDMEAEMRREDVPLWSLESRLPIGEFDVLGFSLQYELTFTNILNMLDLAGIPIRSSERSSEEPVVIAGGSVAFNPEPMSPFIDAFVLGEGEEVILEIVELLRRWKRAPVSHQERLGDLAQIAGVYVPALYEARYGADGTLEATLPREPGVPKVVHRRIVEPLPPALVRPVVPFLQTVHDRGAIEIQRGCTQGCRFCQAGMIYRPTRERSVAEVVSAAEELLPNTGYDELSLLSLSATDHSQIVPMVEALTTRFPGLKISLPSTRVDSFSVDVADAVSRGKKHTLTLAPEAGTERLRHAVNKLIDDDQVIGAADAAFSRGWTSIKMYFMVGLPTETLEDVQGIVDLARSVREIGRGYLGPRARVRVSTSNLVPKPHTPFQWACQDSADELRAKHALLRDGCRTAGVEFSWNSPEDSFLEATMSRGDRRTADVVEAAWRAGARFDAWGEFFQFDRWERAFHDCGVDWTQFSQRLYDTREVLPWDHIDSGVEKSYLRGQWLATSTGKTVGDCHHGGCNVCGLQSFETGSGDGVAGCRGKVEELISESRARRRSAEREGTPASVGSSSNPA